MNLPAYLVIIKGTFCYRGVLEGFVELEVNDINQMLGRAGRKGFETKGVGVIMTGDNNVDLYSDLVNKGLEVESYLGSFLNETINTEISLQNIVKAADIIKFLKCTF
eukprot:CAMPEP_0116901128 /NCGR_PEP_ID=MMETSP0467-20121206/9139_1 /TAXON_ID=283647 /ORGANISM="Mesodinium pulex, Strain SPMC105" /LENGTH=106 /DNA_ID=CAMNT_0004574523 /DNA_START=579 /DNA_END=899 /DNA_ORIENTATION=-